MPKHALTETIWLKNMPRYTEFCQVAKDLVAVQELDRDLNVFWEGPRSQTQLSGEAMLCRKARAAMSG